MSTHQSNDRPVDPAVTIAQRRSCAPQWRAFLEALAVSLPGTVGDGAALRVLAQTGAALATSHPLPVCGSLDELANAMNGVFETFDWGTVEVCEAATALEIGLTGYPCFGGAKGKAIFAATVEGLLDAWMAKQAERPGLAVRLVDHDGGEYPRLIFRYERLGPPAPRL
jgi:hypothetical protein